MRIISHRGNLFGPNLIDQNKPKYILNAIAEGFDVEVDVWWLDDQFYLGHDGPEHCITRDFLGMNELWCHAKNYYALFELLKLGANCFWHQEDDLTVTSNGYIWTHSKNNYSCNKSIFCWINGQGEMPSEGYGICTDYPFKAREINNRASRSGDVIL